MIDLDDLRDLRICEKCKLVYMPDMEHEPYSEESYPRNPKYCSLCKEVRS